MKKRRKKNEEEFVEKNYNCSYSRCMVIGGSVVSFAGETSEGNLSAANSEVPGEIIVEAVNNEPGIELYSNKHRNVKEVVSKKCYCREKGSKPHNGYTVVRKKPIIIMAKQDFRL